MRIFKTKTFNKWLKKNNIKDDSLINSAIDVSKGRYDANLGGSIYKKRVATKGRGKSGSARTIVAFKVRGHVFFLYGFEKNERSSISESEERSLKLVAKGILNKSDAQLSKLVTTGSLFEVDYE
jgi:hypothetical protein